MSQADRRRLLALPGRRWLPTGASVAVGLFLICVGVLLLVDPEAGGRLFGLEAAHGTGYGFHRVTGVRQAYLGVLVLALAWARQSRALGIVLVTLAVVPAGDFIITLATPPGELSTAAEHLLGLLVAAVGALVLATHRQHRQPPHQDQAGGLR